MHELIAATGRLLGDLDGLSDAQVAGPSLLPGCTAVTYSPTWRETPQAEPGCWGWARTGVPSYEYQSLEARAAAIDAGADRPAATST